MDDRTTEQARIDAEVDAITAQFDRLASKASHLAHSGAVALLAVVADDSDDVTYPISARVLRHLAAVLEACHRCLEH